MDQAARREFEIEMKQFELSKQQQQFEFDKKQFELDKITSHHELQHQRNKLTMQQLEIDKVIVLQQKEKLQKERDDFDAKTAEFTQMEEQIVTCEKEKGQLEQKILETEKKINESEDKNKQSVLLLAAQEKINETLKESLKKATYLETMYNEPGAQLYQKQLATNLLGWKFKLKQEAVTYARELKEYQENKSDRYSYRVEPKKVENNVGVVFKFTNLNKNMHICYPSSCSHLPLVCLFYPATQSLVYPIFSHWFKKSYDNGTIPKLTNNLKLFFLSQHVNDGRANGSWVQFHGPGKAIDGNSYDYPISIFSLLDHTKPGSFRSASDEDRCQLGWQECRQQHKETDPNYQAYHTSPRGICTSQYEILIRWE